MNEFEYYILREVEAPAKPAVAFTGKSKESELLVETPIKTIKLVEMKFGGPSPKSPLIMDMHGDGVIELVSDRIYNVLSPLNICGIQLLPATYLDPKSKTVYDKFFFLHIHNYIKCLDLEKTDIVGDADFILAINRIVLDENILSNIPLADRLVFRLEEDRPFQLFHKSIVDKIMEVNPTGLRFVKVEDYNPGSAFS